MWVLKDNLLDYCDVTQGANVTGDYNGYWINPNNSTRMTPTGTHDVVLTSAPPYQSSTLGNYYISVGTPLNALFNAGSRTAAQAGLYHYTTRTSQVKEGAETESSQVNIGLH